MLKILLTGKAIADIKNIYDYIFKTLMRISQYWCTVVRTAFAKNGLPLFCQQKSICHFL